MAGDLGDFDTHLACCSVRGRVFEETKCKVYFPARDRGWVCISGSMYSVEHEYKAKLANSAFCLEDKQQRFLGVCPRAEERSNSRQRCCRATSERCAYY